MDFPRSANERPVILDDPLPTREELESAALDLITNIVRVNSVNTNQNRSWPLPNETPPTNWTENPGIHNPNIRSPNIRSPNIRSPNICRPNTRSPNIRRYGWSPSPTSVEMTEYGSSALLIDPFREG